MSMPGKRPWLGWMVLAAGFAFLYLPILLLMVYSFNESRLATVWTGFSTKWYGELLRDRQLLQAAWISLKVAFWTASAAVLLGTMAALAMVRFGRFRGRTGFGALVTAPLVMPEVILGLSTLLLLVSMGGLFGLPSKGLVAIWIAHVTFTLAYVTVVVSSRLSELDKSLEEAALDLGETQWSTFRLIILPLVMPGIISALLMSFTISLDEFIIAFFLAGNEPTLPTYIFSQLRFPKQIPMIMALGTVLVVMSIILLTIAEYFRRRGVARTGAKDTGGFL